MPRFAPLLLCLGAALTGGVERDPGSQSARSYQKRASMYVEGGGQIHAVGAGMKLAQENGGPLTGGGVVVAASGALEPRAGHERDTTVVQQTEETEEVTEVTTTALGKPSARAQIDPAGAQQAVSPEPQTEEARMPKMGIVEEVTEETTTEETTEVTTTALGKPGARAQIDPAGAQQTVPPDLQTEEARMPKMGMVEEVTEETTEEVTEETTTVVSGNPGLAERSGRVQASEGPQVVGVVTPKGEEERQPQMVEAKGVLVEQTEEEETEEDVVEEKIVGGKKQPNGRTHTHEVNSKATLPGRTHTHQVHESHHTGAPKVEVHREVHAQKGPNGKTQMVEEIVEEETVEEEIVEEVIDEVVVTPVKAEKHPNTQTSPANEPATTPGPTPQTEPDADAEPYVPKPDLSEAEEGETNSAKAEGGLEISRVRSDVKPSPVREAATGTGKPAATISDRIWTTVFG